jgi:hypothetical protein
MHFNRGYLFFDTVNCFLHKSVPSCMLFYLYSASYMKVYFGVKDEVVTMHITSSNDSRPLSWTKGTIYLLENT